MIFHIEKSLSKKQFFEKQAISRDLSTFGAPSEGVLTPYITRLFEVLIH